MKKLLFVIFFPITIPAYIYFKICKFLFSWIIDTFIPFMKNKAFPFLKSKILYATNKFIQKRAATDHLTPYTNDEYLKIKRYETIQQIKCLKKYQKLDSFNACYESGKVYEYWGADYRLLAIKSFEECLKYPPTLPIGIVYSTLATLYEKNHQFEEAADFFQKDIDSTPYYSSGYNGKARCLVKLGKFDEAIDMLEAVKETEYYKNPIKDPAFARSIDRTIEKCIAKKEHGYIFKPRKKSFDYIDPNNFSLDEICNEYLQKWS